MSAELAAFITMLAPDSLQINIWPCEKGFQANVKERASKGWTCAFDADALTATLKALRSRATCMPDRKVVSDANATQIDLEEAIRASSVDCAHGVPMHLQCGACEAEASVSGAAIPTAAVSSAGDLGL